MVHEDSDWVRDLSASKAAVEAVLEWGTHFFYEMDDKGPLNESILWVHIVQPDPKDENAVITVRRTLAELTALHDTPAGIIH